MLFVVAAPAAVPAPVPVAATDGDMLAFQMRAVRNGERALFQVAARFNYLPRSTVGLPSDGIRHYGGSEADDVRSALASPVAALHRN